MKRYSDLWDKIIDKENIKKAHQMARKDKSFYTEVKYVDANLDKVVDEIYDMLKNKTYTIKSSDYTKNKAPQAFDDLIQNISARYILVSFNNMAHKGNSRSNAKISNEEILESLKKRGSVEIFSTDFNAFTTGKSKIENHKELLYLCKINS